MQGLGLDGYPNWLSGIGYLVIAMLSFLASFLVGCVVIQLMQYGAPDLPAGAYLGPAIVVGLVAFCAALLWFHHLADRWGVPHDPSD